MEGGASTFGFVFLGTLFNWGLFGVLTVQVYIYYLAFPLDARRYKLFVGIVYLLEVAQTTLVTRDGFLWFGTGWGNYEKSDGRTFIWLSVPLLCGIVSFMVQCFLAWRIYIFSKFKILLFIIPLLALSQLTGAVVLSVRLFQLGTFSITVRENAYKPTIIWLGCSALCDVLIAVGMSYCLLRKNPTFEHSQIIISKLVRLTIETGLVTASVTTLTLILFLCLENGLFYASPSLIVAKLYSNNLLVAFNFRVRILGGRGSATMSIHTVESSSSTAFNQSSGWLDGPVSRRSQTGYIKSLMGRSFTERSTRPDPTPINVQVQIKRQIEMDDSPIRTMQPVILIDRNNLYSGNV